MPIHWIGCGQKPASTWSARHVSRSGEYLDAPCRGACATSTSTTDAPPESTSAFVNFCLPIEPSIGSTASRRYALKAQPKSEIATPVKRRSMPLITREGSERPTGSLRPRLRPLATSLPASTASTSRGMSSGSFCRSPSIVTTTSPRARARPACIAGCWPKLRLKRTARTRASLACRRSRAANVPSVEPSSTKISSNVRGPGSSVATVRRYSSSTDPASSKTVTTIETSGAGRSASVTWPVSNACVPAMATEDSAPGIPLSRDAPRRASDEAQVDACGLAQAAPADRDCGRALRGRLHRVPRLRGPGARGRAFLLHPGRTTRTRRWDTLRAPRRSPRRRSLCPGDRRDSAAPDPGRLLACDGDQARDLLVVRPADRLVRERAPAPPRTAARVCRPRLLDRPPQHPSLRRGARPAL